MPSLGLGLGLHKQIMMGFKQPIATFTRPTPAYLSDGTQVTANVPRFESGKFGKAILVEEETTNLLVKDLDTGGSGSIIDILVPNKVWAKRMTVGANNFFYFGTISVPAQPNTKYTLTYWARLVSGSVVGGTRIYIRSDSQEITSLNINTQLTSEWKKFVITGQIDANATTLTRAAFRVQTDTGCTVEIADWQLEAKPYPTSFTDGTRAAETLTIPTERVLNPQEGAVECWVYIDDRFIDGMAGKYAWIWGTKGDPYYPILNLYRNAATNSLRFVSRDANNNQSYIEKPLSQISVGWHYIACTWKSSRLAFLLDGQLVGEVVSPYLPNAVDAQMYIGHNPRVGEQCNSLIDDLRISNRARSDAEILAAYQSGKPLQRDEWTTYKADFDEKIR